MESRAVAVHEAAHAVIAERFGRKVNEIRQLLGGQPPGRQRLESAGSG